jgi:hypothetical protein
MANPDHTHMQAGKGVLRYIKGSLDRGLLYKFAGDNTLSALVDSDFAHELESRRSRSGYVVRFGDSTIDWKSSKQKCVATSTFAAETIALSEVAKAIVAYRVLAKELGVEQHGPTTIYEDNRAAMLYAMEGSGLRKIKHVDVRYRFAREAVLSGAIKVVACASKDNVADIFTKALPRQLFLQHADSLFGH